MPEGESLTVQPIGTPRPAARQEPRLRGTRLRDRSTDRLHDRPRRLPGRHGGRAQDDPRQRPAVGRRLHVPPERVRSRAAPRHPRHVGGLPLWDAKVPLTDSAGGSPYVTMAVPGRDLGLQLLLGRNDVGEGVARRAAVPDRRHERRRRPDQVENFDAGHVCYAATTRSPTSSGISIGLPDFGEYTLLIAKRDPGQGIVWTAFVCLITGITITFYLTATSDLGAARPGWSARPGLPCRSLRRRRARVRLAARRPGLRPPPGVIAA